MPCQKLQGMAVFIRLNGGHLHCLEKSLEGAAVSVSHISRLK